MCCQNCVQYTVRQLPIGCVLWEQRHTQSNLSVSLKSLILSCHWQFIMLNKIGECACMEGFHFFAIHTTVTYTTDWVTSTRCLSLDLKISFTDIFKEYKLGHLQQLDELTSSRLIAIAQCLCSAEQSTLGCSIHR